MSKKVLIIEKDPEDQESIKECLARDNHVILFSTDSSEGMEKAIAEKPDFIVVGDNISGMDGFEFCKQVKSNKDSNAAKVIFMTQMTEMMEAAKAKHSGADDYIVRTDNFQTLVKSIRRLHTDQP